MVYVLGRMGSADKALRLIVQDLRDVEQVGCFLVLQWFPGVSLCLMLLGTAGSRPSS